MNKISQFVVFTIIAMIALGNSYKTFAQNTDGFYIEEPRTFYGGLLAGANFSQVDGDNFAGYHKVGLNLGGIVYTHLAEKLAASLEILYSQKGSRSNREQATATRGIITKYTINLNYVEVPLMLNYFDRRKSHFGGGFSYSQLINSKEDVQTSLGPVATDSFKFKKMDLNIVLGGNLHLVKGLFLNLRFQYSLISIRNNIPPEFGNRGVQYNNLWTVRLMYLF